MGTAQSSCCCPQGFIAVSCGLDTLLQMLQPDRV